MGLKKTQLEIGAEYPEEGEDLVVDDMIKRMQVQMTKMYPNPKSLRQVHSKMHGCVKAEFIVEKNLPADLRIGVFKEAKSYCTWLRLSNGKTEIRPDRDKDTRGFALKLMDVPGEKLLQNQKDAKTQDFILASGPTFFTKNIKDFNGLLKASTKGKLWGLLYLLTDWPLLFRVFFKIFIKCPHALGIPYYSTTPYRFGDSSRAVKYRVSHSSGKLEYMDNKDPDYLRKSLVATLAKNEILFDFCIQFQTDADEMPIENALVEWKSPFIKVATIRIPSQVFDTKEQNEFGENLTCNIWHCLPEHTPLGGFNRARRKMYDAMYKFRHEKNQVLLSEPQVTTTFFDNLKPA